MAIARALATKPQVLLCDEPTSALDPFTTATVLQYLADVNREFGITVVIVTHEMEVIKALGRQRGGAWRTESWWKVSLH